MTHELNQNSSFLKVALLLIGLICCSVVLANESEPSQVEQNLVEISPLSTNEDMLNSQEATASLKTQMRIWCPWLLNLIVSVGRQTVMLR